MLESRIRIHFGKDYDLSSQFPLQCNFMTEGCNGGWGAFKGFFLEQFYTVLESCAPYEAKTYVDGCKKYKECEPIAKVDKTYYLGGHYGGMSEENIIRELRANGPVLFDFAAGADF
jgi:cathepsin C